MARKCSLPIRVFSPGSNMLPEDGKPQEVSEEQMEGFALRAFFYDYCITSTNRSLSRGYLDGLEPMVHRLGRHSDLAKACITVACASHGISKRRPALASKAQLYYFDLLGSLAKTIQNPAVANNAESLMVVTLLGLYEMVVATEAQPDNWKAHARGVAAILQIEHSPLDLFGAVRFTRSSHPWISNGPGQQCSLFLNPYSSDTSQSLDSLLLQFGPLWRQANGLLANPLNASGNLALPLIRPEELYRLKNEAVALDRAFAKWQYAQVKDFKPWAVGHVSHREPRLKPEVGHWLGRIDTYFDLYVASVWNISRTARILLINLILKLSHILNDDHTHMREHQDAARLIEDMIASIPFHLAEDLPTFLRDLEKEEGVAKIESGRYVGGLLLIHHLHIVAKLATVPQQIKRYMTDCLEWIATNMGIGQALVFAKMDQLRGLRRLDLL
ncbi:MAG: hypothetical protein Q9213_003869 [Squamulea squamosa]